MSTEPVLPPAMPEGAYLRCDGVTGVKGLLPPLLGVRVRHCLGSLSELTKLDTLLPSAGDKASPLLGQHIQRRAFRL